MEFELKTIRKSLNQAFRRDKVERDDFNNAAGALNVLVDEIRQAKKAGETEEHFKTFLTQFLNNAGFGEYYINTDGRTDLVIHNGSKKSDTVGVMIETKKPGSREMITSDDLNRKALHEAVLYYLQEIIEKGNTEVKHIVITDLDHWFIFDAQEFNRHFKQNGPLESEFNKWNTNQKTSSSTSFMYGVIEEYLEALEKPLKGTFFDLGAYTALITEANRTKEQEEKLIPLIKLLSPVHLLKKPFSNDSNSLNTPFYNELLYIIGLEEKKDGSTKLISRPDEDDRVTDSLIENTINTLRYENRLRHIKEPAVTYGEEKEDQLFGVALELCIHWVNRILFLKLLEAQLYRYHQGSDYFAFLNYATVDEFDELNKLFFRVLAIKEEDRHPADQEKYGHIPYLNSSLFDVAELEDKTTRISGLDDKVTMPVYSGTVLKDKNGKSEKGKELNTLEYLFAFLDAYDFSAEGKEEIQEESKNLINASVLGLIFEKINGYKDGSFYTPGFITEYMCRETLRKAVTDKFNRLYKWDCDAFSELYNKISREQISLPEADQVVNSLTVCDPAVGSGHFLVSALNEMIAIKSELGILCDTDGKVFGDMRVQVENDELIVTYGYDELFEYDVKPKPKNGGIERSVNARRQRIQKALFEEKRRLIENSLFGVDINANSVRICRLRLWIELLKNAYYTEESSYQKLEVLPNIDINIKQGNSLVSRFDLDADLEQILNEADYTLDDYKQAVSDYKETRDQEKKRELRSLIGDMKEAFTVGLEELHPERIKLKEAKAKLIREQTQHDMFGDDDEHGGSREVRVQKFEKALAKQQEVVDELEAGTFYRQAFEWRFEFPEVLDDEGTFTGFDVVIGNPPYVRQEQLKDLKNYLKDKFEVYSGYADLYQYFIQRGMEILKEKGYFHYIVSNKWMRASYGQPLREWMQQYQIKSLIDFGDLPVFQEATAYPCLLQMTKTGSITDFIASEIEDLKFDNLEKAINEEKFVVDQQKLKKETWSLITKKKQNFITRIESKAEKLEQIVDGNIFRGVISGLDDAFVIDGDKKDEIINEDSKSEDLIFPYLRGKDVGKYSKLNSSQHLIFMPSGWTDKKTEKDLQNKWGWLKETYPGVANHLEPYAEDAKKRYDQGNYWWELRPCDYFEEFQSPKLLYLKFQVKPAFTLDLEGHICNSAVWFVSETDKQLLAILNSKLGWFLISIYCTQIRNGYQLIYKYLKNIPIILNDTFQQKFDSLVDQILTAKEENPEADTTALEADINPLVYELYGLTEEEIAIVEESVG